MTLAKTVRTIRTILALLFLWTQGCASTDFVAQQAVEDKIARIKLGETSSAEVETILGPEHSSDRHFWMYNLSDTSFEIAERPSGLFKGILPIMPMNAPTNTRVLVTLRFTENGIVKGLDVERYFEAPYTNDYWYLMNGASENALERVSQMAAASGLRVVHLDKAKGTLALDDGVGKACLVVTAHQQTLHVQSTIPYDRLSQEYRVFKKREIAFTEKINISKTVR